MGDGAFRGCTGLRNLIVPEGMTEISNYLFQDCTELRTVLLPETVTTIGRYAFSGCKNLETMVIPAGVAEIGDEAFASTGMWSIIFQGNAPVIAKNAFRNTKTEAQYSSAAQGWNPKTAVSYGGELTWKAE